MKAGGHYGLLIALSALTTACDQSILAPDGNYTGQWSGTTVQGTAITFTVSADERVTTITLGHDFNGCSGSETFSGLSLNIKPDVECIPGVCPPGVSSYRSFGYMAGNPVQGPSTQIDALFLSTERAAGSVNFRSYPGCGNAIGVAWTANRR
jgi:hypothetical protein